MKNVFKHNDIEVALHIHEDSTLHNYKNEYKQVLLNLLSNAKDVLVERKIFSPKISMMIHANRVTVSDNAGGIDKAVLSRICEPYFTTKEGNSGIGLYMSKMIVERNMRGVLKVDNTDKGAEFTIWL